MWRKSNSAIHKKKIIATVKYGGGSVMVWSNFPASGPGSLVLTDGIINAALYQTVLRENV